MNAGRTIFSQLMSFLPHKEFQKCVERYLGDPKGISFTAFDQFLAMAFAQLTYRESLRDIQECLRAIPTRLYHMGIRSPVAKSTLADANEKRDWRIFADFAQVLIGRARRLYATEDFSTELEAAALYALDSSTIDLCLSLFPWAKFRRTKVAVKLHTLLNLRGNIPEFIHISDGKLADVKILDMMTPQPGAFYIMDRGYLDFARLYTLHQAQAFFVTRAKQGFRCQRRYSHPVNQETGLRFDQTVFLTGFYPAKNYPETLRRIGYRDLETAKRLVFLTNNFELPPLTIARLYKLRWQVELFFKWIKQHLRIKAFYGTSDNAVKTQIWIAIAVYVLIAIIKKELRLPQSLYTILQVVSVTLFEKVPILQAFSEVPTQDTSDASCNQLTLFD
jgi:hypothetical protein